MSRAKRVLAAVFTSALLVGVVSSPAMAVNDPFVPGDNTQCAAEDSQAAGRPAILNQQPQGANPPFSLNNPGGVSGGADAVLHQQATAHCENNQP